MTQPVPDVELDLARECTLLPILRILHDRWIADVRAELAPALRPAASPWERFAAIRYLDTVFRLRLRRESDAIDAVAGLVAPRQGTTLLATAQLLDLLRVEIGDLSQQAASDLLVPPLLHALVQQLEHWCADVEVAFGWMRRDTMAPEALDGFLAVSELPAGPYLH